MIRFLGFAIAVLSIFLDPSFVLAQVSDKLQEYWSHSSQNLYDTACGTQFQSELMSRLSASKAIDYQLPELAGLTDLISPDAQLRVITWTHALSSEETLYKGIVVYRPQKDSLRVLALKDRHIPVKQGYIDDKWFNLECSANEWIGAVYYGIQPFDFQGIKAYLLLGVAGRTPLCTRKVIETLYIDTTGDVHWGLPCLAYSSAQIFQRIFYSYSTRVAMTLQLIEKGKKVLIDHLAPSSAQYSGLPQFYGPDGSQDAFVLSEGGYWRHESDVLISDPTEHSNNQKRIYNKGF